MKGQLGIPTEYLLNVLSFILLTITILGSFIAVAQYQLTYKSRADYRQFIDFMENFLSDRCVAYEENGNLWKGIFDKNKLDSYLQRSSHCIQFSKNIYIRIKDQKNEWEFWPPEPYAIEEELSYPVVVKYDDGFLTGMMEVKSFK